MLKRVKVKNKSPAAIQITAEQLLREAKERDLELLPTPPTQKISDLSELKEYQQRKRKQFEDSIRKNRGVISTWIKYAQWEESQKEIHRARSVYERALDVDHKNVKIWFKYAEMEMKNRQINHARNLWDKAVTILPRVNQFWYKYTYMEELLGNIIGARSVFERWMKWEPDERAWQTYINFELRHEEVERSRKIFEKFILAHCKVENWIKFANFEENHGFISNARCVYEKAVLFYGDKLDEKLLTAFAKFEENQKEYDRARAIYKYGLEHIPNEETIRNTYTVFEKKYGNTDVILSKRKIHYEQEIHQNPINYDSWFDYLRLVEEEGNIELTRDIYERAIANIPPTKMKPYWRRYMYLWINYAIFEELEAEQYKRARHVYKACLDVISHKNFTFSKIWILYAQFEIRQKNVSLARKILGVAIGRCPTSKLFRAYIDIETNLGEFDRCRILYRKFLEFKPENCVTWMRFAELEDELGDLDRARAIYELGVNQQVLDMPELLWKAYIDFEILQNEIGNARKLFERLLERTSDVKVWLSYAQFELGNDIDKSRKLYERANEDLKIYGSRESRVLLLEKWKHFEKIHGNDGSVERVTLEMPKKFGRQVVANEESWGKNVENAFVENNEKLLKAAKNWKKLNFK